ncbi:MAG TPA: VOC family protein [Mycobacteriales bacterium]|nr:VOC family protein [Mycobacteriales bacterium]
MLAFDHATFITPDAAATAAAWRERHGIGTRRNGYLPHLGARSWPVPLAPPSYLELLDVEDEDVAASTPLGQRVLALRDAGGGPIAWCVRVADLEAVARRLGLKVFQGATEAERGTLGWASASGPDHLPFFIAYGGDEDARVGRWHEGYALAGHESAPGEVTRINVAGSPEEYAEWLGPHDLPLRFVDGPPGLVAVAVATARGEVEIAQPR